jgi:hypothetical protein
MRVMDKALTVGLGPSLAVGRCMQGASGPLGWYVLGYMDYCLVHLQRLEQHLLDVAEVLEIFRQVGSRGLQAQTIPWRSSARWYAGAT